jgi:hypothetical protein
MQTITISIGEFQSNIYKYIKRKCPIIVTRRRIGIKLPEPVFIIEHPTADNEEACDRCHNNLKCILTPMSKGGNLYIMWLCAGCINFFKRKGLVINFQKQYERTNDVSESDGEDY